MPKIKLGRYVHVPLIHVPLKFRVFATAEILERIHYPRYPNPSGGPALITVTLIKVHIIRKGAEIITCRAIESNWTASLAKDDIFDAVHRWAYAAYQGDGLRRRRGRGRIFEWRAWMQARKLYPELRRPELKRQIERIYAATDNSSQFRRVA